MSAPKPSDHTLDAIRSLVATPEDRLELYGVSTAAWAAIVRHLLDVVGRQRAELERHEWTELDGECLGCKALDVEGHKPDCALDALLRETA